MVAEVSIKDYLARQIKDLVDVKGIIVTDRDGVAIVQEWSSEGGELKSSFSHNPQIAAAFSGISEQANKLGLGTSDIFIISYRNHQVVQINEIPNNHVIITVFTGLHCNTGLIMEKRALWRELAETIQRTVLSRSVNV